MIKDLDDETEAWIDAVVPILETVRERDGSERSGLEMIEENFRIPGDASTYVDTLAVLYDRLGSPNEEEYTLRPSEDTPPASLVSVFINRPPKGDLREETTKSIYMMLSTNVEWKWDKLISAIESRLNLIYNKDEQMSEIGQGEYAGLIGSLIVLASQGNVSEAKELLDEKRRNGSLYFALSLSREHPASAAACTLALLFVGNEMDREKAGQLTAEPISRSRESGAIRPDSFFSENPFIKGLSKGHNIFDNIVNNPSKYKEVCKKMYDLIQRTGLSIKNHTDWRTNRDIAPLQKFISKWSQRDRDRKKNT